jgi:hypothetical protein
MFTRIIIQRRTRFEKWMSGRTLRAATLLGALLLVSVAINALIILADGSKL